MRRLFALMGAIVIGSSVGAQEFHGGLSLDYGLPHSGDDQTAVTFLGGVMAGGPTFKYGVEAEVSLPIAGDTDYDTARLRLMGSYDFGDYTVIAGAGLSRYETDTLDIDGQNVSLGVQRAISDRVSLRAEFIRDFWDDDTTPAITTTRIGAIYNFY